jgi:hypothetical protein
MIDLITTKEAAGILGCAQRTVNEYIRRGKILPSQKVKGKHLLEKEKVLNLLYHNLSSSKNSYFNPCFKSSFEKRNLTDIIDKWQIHSRDTSSADVQIGIYNPSCYLKKVIENAAINIINFRTNPRSVTA